MLFLGLLFTFLSKTRESCHSRGAHLSISTPLAWWSLWTWFPCPERREPLSSFSFSMSTEKTIKTTHLCCPLVLLVHLVLGDPSVQEYLTHMRNIIKFHCVEIQILYFNYLVFSLTRNPRKSTITCKKYILSCWSQLTLIGIYLNLHESKCKFPHLSAPEVQNHLRRKSWFYEWLNQHTYLGRSNHCRHAFWSRCSFFSFQRVRKWIYVDIKAGFSHIQMSLILFYCRMSPHVCFTFHRIWLKFSHDQLPDGSLQGSVVQLIPRRPSSSSSLASRSQVDSIVRAGQCVPSRTPVDVRRLQRIYDVEAGGGREAAGPGRSSASDGFKGGDPFLEAFYFCTCQWWTWFYSQRVISLFRCTIIVLFRV